MNKYQLIVYWVSIFVITIALFPLFFFVFEFEILKGIIISVIVLVLIWGASLFISLRGRDEIRVKETWKLIKKFIFIIGSIAILLSAYLVVHFIINIVDERDIENKKELLQQHIQKEYWFANNLILTEGHLRSSKDRSFSEYSILKELAFIVENKSPIDFFPIELKLSIYDSQGELYEEKDIYCLKSIPGNSRVKIDEYFYSAETNFVPTNFEWSYSIKSAEISSNYLSEYSFDQIESFIDADSSSLENPIQKLLYSIDWDTVDVN